MSDDGDTLPLDDKGWAHIRYTLVERPWGFAWHVELEEDCSQVGGYNFEYAGRWLNDPEGQNSEGATTGVLFTLPTEYLVEHGPGQVRALALELARELPFSFGYASLAIIAPHGRWFAARKSLTPVLSRYLGLDIYKLIETGAHIGGRARGAYWMTFLGQPLLGQLGGLEGLREKLPLPQVSFEPLERERLLLHAGGVAGGDGHFTAGVCAGVPGPGARAGAVPLRRARRLVHVVASWTGQHAPLDSAACASEPRRAVRCQRLADAARLPWGSMAACHE